jgi:hypothetical protein
LAQLWLDASDRRAGADAADTLDAALTVDPLNLGESRLGPVRVAFEGVLGILFEVSEPDRLVTVLDVWRCG